jgi:GAF domain-containing protein
LIDRAPIVRRLLEITGLSDYFAERPPPGIDATGDDPIEDRMRSIITDLAGIVLTATSLHDDLEHLIRFSCEVLPGCSAASIALLIDGEPTTVAVSEHVAFELDIAQYDNDEGPCLTALSGERIRVDIIAADERFPHFAMGAAEHRVNSILSMPIIHHGDVIGTLNFYSRHPDAFDDTADHIARLASGQAAHAIARSDVLTTARHRRDQLQAHYDEAALLARAQGVLIATERCSAEQARNLIHHAATTTGDTLLAIAGRILDAARTDTIP